MAMSSKYFAADHCASAWNCGAVLIRALVFLTCALCSPDNSATTLTVNDGVIVKYGSGASMVVRDGLHTGKAVSFTSVNDDGAAGQSLPAPGTPNPGDWGGLQILPTAAPAGIAINGLTLKYAGSNSAAALEISHNTYLFDALLIADSLLGIRALDATAAQFTNLSLLNNNVGVEASQNAAPNISHSEIRGNTQLGVLNLTPQTVVPALQNWWGHASGPYDPAGNPSGLGDAVSAGVNYGQYFTAPPLLACSLAVADGNYTIAQQSVVLSLACRNAVTYRLSESTNFGSAAYSPIGPTAAYTFTGGARTFTLYAQYQAADGSTVTVNLPTPITYAPPTPPVVTITSPASGAQISADTQISANVATSVGIASVDFYVDTTKIMTVSTAPYQALWTLSGFAAGSHALRVVATDVTGQTGEASETVQLVAVDTAGPSVQNVTFSGTPLSDGATISSPGTLAAQVSDPSGVATVALALDGQAVAGGALSGTQYSIPLLFDQTANGGHTLLLTATDTRGNTSSVSIGITLALPPPGVPVITSPANGMQVNQPSVGVSGTGTPGSQVQLYVDAISAGSPILVSAAGTFSATLTFAVQGAHAITADAHSPYGMSGTSVPVSVTYTAPPPSIVITSPAKNAIITADTDVSVAIIDTADLTSVEFDIDGSAVATLTTTPYTWHWSIASATAGNHTVAVKAIDSIGNVLQASVPVSVQITPPPPPPIVTPYTGSIDLVSPTLSYGEQPITINGHSVDRLTSTPVPNSLLNLILQVNGFKRQISVTTDGAGAFSYVFHPYPNDAGTYIVSVIHPQETTLTPQGQFTINRLGVSPSTFNLQAARTVTTTIPITVSASSGTGVSGVYLSADPEAQPSGSLPPGITLSPTSPINLSGGASAQINVQFTADNSGGNTGTVILVAHASDSGSASRGSVAVNYSLSAPTPALYPQPTFVQTGVSQGNQVLATVKLQNKGLIAATNVVAQLLNNDGSTNVPAWVNLVSGGTAAALDVGAEQVIQISAAPTTSVSDSIYNFKIRVTAGNATGGDIPVSISVTQSGVGNVMFNASDIYTNTLDTNGQTIPGLAGATIKVQNQNVYTVLQSATTEASGNAEIDGLPVGYYTFVANAPNHSTVSGVFTVLPGVTATQSVFLDYNVVSIQWSVTETDIPDQYQVTLDATYQTQVPAPVLLIEPASVNLPDMQVGEVYAGEMTITNYGLVRADDLVLVTPSDDSYFKYEFMGTMPSSLDAHQRISIPYKITSLAALPASTTANFSNALKGSVGTKPTNNLALAIGRAISGTGTSASSAGGCGTYTTWVLLKGGFVCANGTPTDTKASSVFAKIYGSSCTSTSGGSSSSGGSGGPDAGGFGGPTGGMPQGLGTSPGCSPLCNTCPCKGGANSGGGS